MDALTFGVMVFLCFLVLLWIPNFRCVIGVHAVEVELHDGKKVAVCTVCHKILMNDEKTRKV